MSSTVYSSIYVNGNRLTVVEEVALDELVAYLARHPDGDAKPTSAWAGWTGLDAVYSKLSKVKAAARRAAVGRLHLKGALNARGIAYLLGRARRTADPVAAEESQWLVIKSFRERTGG